MNKVYEITGPESLSHMQVADILSEHIGKRISYVNISEEDARNRMKKMGIHALELYDIYRSGYRAQTTDVAKLLTGERPVSFAEIAKNYVQNGISWPNQSRVLTGWLKFE